MKNIENILKKSHIVFSFFVVLVSFLLVVFVQKYYVLTDEDIMCCFLKEYIMPDDGRYLTNFLSFLIVGKMPLFFNIHANDWQPSVMAYIKSLILVCFFLFLTNVMYIFSEKKIKFYNFSFIFLYTSIFFFIFNYNKIIIFERPFCHLEENIVFFEYIMGAFLYCIFWTVIFKSYINGIDFRKRNVILLVLLSFFVGLSVEAMSGPTFISFILFSIFLIYKHKKLIFKDYKKEFFICGLTFLLFLFARYLNFINNVYLHSSSLKINLIMEHIVEFTKHYFIFIKNIIMPYILPILILIIFLIFNKSYDKDKKRKIIVFVIINVLSFLILYYCTQFIDIYFVPKGIPHFVFSPDLRFVEKIVSTHLVAFVFYFLILFGFVCDQNIKFSNRKSNIIKFIFSLIVVLSIYNPVLKNYGPEIQNYLEEKLILRKMAYQMEKMIIIEKDKSYVELPSYFFDLFKKRSSPINSILEVTFMSFIWNMQIIPDFTMEESFKFTNDSFLKRWHKEIEDKDIRIKFSDNVDISQYFTEEELKELKFQNLVK